MMAQKGGVHEPGAELLSAEDAIRDAERLRALFQKWRDVGRPAPLRVPLWALLETIDALEPEALRQVVQRAEARLAVMPPTH